MASLLRKAYLAEGTHKVSLINSGKGARPMVNGGILSGSKNVDNGILVEFDGFDENGRRKYKPWEGTNEAFIIANRPNDSENGLMLDLGEDDIKKYYIEVGEAITVYSIKTNGHIRQETDNYKSDTELNISDLGKTILYNTTSMEFEIGKSPSSNSIEVGMLVDVNTDLGANADTSVPTIRIEYK